MKKKKYVVVVDVDMAVTAAAENKHKKTAAFSC